jgi:hypothetical protein
LPDGNYTAHFSWGLEIGASCEILSNFAARRRVINQILKAAHKDRRKFFPQEALARYEIREGQVLRSAELGV